ncbi:hypothetical protein MFIFM68171_07287 [Madurella fahalii]|uniref:Dienelactone hydrolase n=1 Tax=Madurella fahalii TaxID=1157608 RepID=A0ABQ0GH30_9PEZI
MNINLPDLVRSALPPDRRRGNDDDDDHAPNKNVAILSDNWTGTMNRNDPSFLSSSFPRDPPKLFLASDTPTPDHAVLAAWRAEGFHVLDHLPLGTDPDPIRTLRSLHRRARLGPCETYGVVAFGEAAARCLEHFHVLDNNPELKMGCLVAYYPPRIPDPRTRFPSAVRGVVVHLPVGGRVGVVRQSQMVGIQGKKRVVEVDVPRKGMGTGGKVVGDGWGGYEVWGYDAEVGFAEEGREEYDGICAGLAWARSLAVARAALLGMQGDGRDGREGVMDTYSEGKWFTRDVSQIMSGFPAHRVPSVTYVPTCSGGTGRDEIEEFYRRYFVDANPPTLETTLLSRTVGADRVVDEIFVSFKHTQEMPWILPGVPPTNKRVEVVLVSIVAFRGGRLHHEHVYWDQASVLVQVGLLDRKVVPQVAKDKGTQRLPVVGRKAARRVFGSVSEAEDVETNDLIRATEGGDDGSANRKNGTSSVENGRTSQPKQKLAERKKAGKESNGEA